MAGLPFGKYQLFERIAAGGMAEIYRAKYVAAAGVTKEMVIKKILPHYAGNQSFVSMFVNEAKIAAGFSHGNIAQVFDFGEIDGEYYLAMEYVHGQAVSKMLRRAREKGLRLPIPHACFIAMELCKGLHYAHTRVDERQRPLGIVHRDVSPQNVLVSYEGQVKIVDFGIAKARIETDRDKTQAGAIKGKYVYFSPEQARAKDLDARSDVFATGVVLYEMLCGQLPFEGPMLEVLGRIVRGEHARPSELNPAIAPALEGIVLKAMATRHEDRYPTALALQEALAGHLYASAPRFNQESLAQLVQYLFDEELAAEGREVRHSPELLAQLPQWQLPESEREGAAAASEGQKTSWGHGRRSRPGAGPKTAGGGGAGRGPAFIRRVFGPASRPASEALDSEPDEPAPGSTQAAYQRPKADLKLAGVVFLIAAALAAAIVVFVGRVRAARAPPAPAAPGGAGTTARAPELKPDPPPSRLAVDAVSASVSIPASRAARRRLDPRHKYEIWVQGAASLGGLSDIYLTRGCFYFAEGDGRSTAAATFGYLGPGRRARIAGARALYGFVLDSTPMDNAGALEIRVKDLRSGAVDVLSVDARSNSLWPDEGRGARFIGLGGTHRYTLEVEGSAYLGGRNGRTDQVIYAYDGNFALTIKGKNIDASHGVIRSGERIALESPTSLLLFFPDDDIADNRGGMTAILR